MKETIWLEYIDADELYEFQNKYSSQFGGMISVPQVMNSEMDKVDQFWVGVCEFMESKRKNNRENQRYNKMRK